MFALGAAWLAMWALPTVAGILVYLHVEAAYDLWWGVPWAVALGTVAAIQVGVHVVNRYC